MPVFYTVPQVVDATGGVVNATAEFFATGTTDALNVFSDSSLQTDLGNEISADAVGRFDGIFLQDTLYRVTVKVDGAVLYSQDDVGVGSTATLITTVTSANASSYFNKVVILAGGETIEIPVGTAQVLKTIEAAKDAIAQWEIPADTEVILKVDSETLSVTGRIARWDIASPNQVVIEGQTPLVKTVTSATNGSFTGTSGAYSITIPLDDTSDIDVGDYINISENEEFENQISRQFYFEYDQKRPYWHFTDMAADNDDQVLFPHGYLVVTDTTTPGSYVDCIIYERDNATRTWSVADNLIASDYITAGRILVVEGQMVEIASVSTTDGTFTLASSLSREIPTTAPETYWYTLANETGTIAQSGTTVTGTGTTFTDYNIGDFIAQDGIYNYITAIASDTSMTVANSHTISAGAAYAIIRTGGALAGCWPITSKTATTITFGFRGYFEQFMEPPVKGIEGGRVEIIKSVLETTGSLGGFAIEREVLRLKNIVVKIDGEAGNVIEPAGANDTNNGHFIAEGTVGLYGGNIGFDSDGGGTIAGRDLKCCAQKFAGMRIAYDRASIPFAVCSGSKLYGLIANGASIYANFMNASANKGQGVLLSTPDMFIADSMSAYGNNLRGVTGQIASYHLVQANIMHSTFLLHVSTSKGRSTGARLLGGTTAGVFTRSHCEGRSSTVSGQAGLGYQVVGGIHDILNNSITGTGSSAIVASQRAYVYAVGLYQHTSASVTFTDGAKGTLTNAVVDQQINLSEGADVDIENSTKRDGVTAVTTNIATRNQMQEDMSIVRDGGVYVATP